MTSSKSRLVNKKEPLNKSTNHRLICYLRVGRGWARGERAPGLLGARPGTDLAPPPLGRDPGSWERGVGTSRCCHRSGTDPAPLLLAPHPAGLRDIGDGERGWGGSLQQLQEAWRPAGMAAAPMGAQGQTGTEHRLLAPWGGWRQPAATGHVPKEPPCPCAPRGLCSAHPMLHREPAPEIH